MTISLNDINEEIAEGGPARGANDDITVVTVSGRTT